MSPGRLWGRTGPRNPQGAAGRRGAGRLAQAFGAQVHLHQERPPSPYPGPSDGCLVGLINSGTAPRHYISINKQIGKPQTQSSEAPTSQPVSPALGVPHSLVWKLPCPLCSPSR